MANQTHLKQLKQGVAKWNKWREHHQKIRPHLSHVNLIGAKLSLADLSLADLRGANLCLADLSLANLDGANLSGANLSDAGLSRASLSGADLSDANLMNANICNADLNDADLSRARLSCDLSFANLRDAALSDSDLSDADLSGACLISANLKSACLIRAKLRGANLSNANLSNADLSYASLSDANLSHAELNSTNLSHAFLIDANLSGANLSSANLQDATANGTIFADLDLRTVKGLTEINHSGPSRIELYTVQFPQDGSALHFLRGAGVPEEWIDSWRTSMMHPIQYHSLFISYSSNDDMLAKRLHADLQAKGVRCWFAPEDLKIGDKIRTRINEAIHVHEKLLLLLSEHALASVWVEDEVEAALEKEQRQQREVLFPVRLDESVMQTSQAWAAKLRRTRHIGDFTCWTDPQAYQRAFERLLRDLHK